VPEKRARHFASICSALLSKLKRPRKRPLLRLLAKAAARTRSVVLYYAVAGIVRKAYLKRRFPVSCQFRGQIDAASWLSIGALHNG
jgi:hypothetical protein